MNKNIKACVDCKWCQGEILFMKTCVCPKSGRTVSVDLVTGEKKVFSAICAVERNAIWIESVLGGYCGKSGRWFEPIQPKQ